MKRHSKIIAGTAVGLLMTSAPLAALPLPVPPENMLTDARSDGAFELPLILIQGTDAAAEEETEEERRRREREQQAEEAEPAPAEEAAPQQQAEEPAAEPEPAQEAEEPAPESEEPARAEEKPQQEEPARAEEPKAAPEQPATAEEPEAAPEEPAKAEEEPQQEEPAQAAEPEAAPEQPATAEEPEAAPEEPARAEEEPQREEPAQAAEPEAAPEQPATAEEPEAAPEEPARAEEEPQREEPAQAAEPEAAPEQPATAEEPGVEPGTEAADQDIGLPENSAPALDSAKEAAPAEGEDQQQQQQAQPAAEDVGPPPESDAAAQAEIEVDREQLETLITEEGQRIEQPQEIRPTVPEGAEVVREVNNRFVIEFNNNYYIERPREERFYVDAEEVYYEELPRGRQREVIVRPDGTRIITVRNRHGDIINRVKVLPDDREVILVYVEEEYYDEVRVWRDPGADMPPLRLNIPVREYILDAGRVEDPDMYYTFLDQPPVERVERTYSLAEVRRSARIRDKVRRIDLDVINFEFGSAQIAETEVQKLEGVANAMQRLLEDNPGETFLIEGHTDAVGADIANLALSDQRAESVASALTNVFDIPPENLATQGYGEQYLKINTEGPERENRRVAIRRITPLVAPVASAE